jgi:hypothetical protein
MRWFDQGIAAAVDKAKREDAIFVVYVEGKQLKLKMVKFHK